MTDQPIAVPEDERDPAKRYTPEGFEVPAPSEDDVRYEVRDEVAWVTLNRPLVLNAVDWSLTYHFGRALERAETDDAAKVVVVTGAGRAFCAGGDLQSARFYPKPDDVPAGSMMDNVMRIWHMPKPVIAAVRGHAVGQGIEIAGMCDMTIASETAQFGEIQIRHGFGPPMLVSPFLTGLKNAKWIMMTGEVFDAEQALRMGIVNEVVSDADLETATQTLARKMASLPPTALALNKLVVNRVYELAGFQQALNYRDDPVIQELQNATRGDTVSAERLATLREQGWEAFKQQRDAAFRE
ncbi:MAG: enoyl-CoA hydratase/isomerase family protein [Dehalococcoidia bacterium]|nr:enoyl-CoA hydratase/isomerase family protein [Dehalococcoidia bacterium]